MALLIDERRQNVRLLRLKLLPAIPGRSDDNYRPGRKGWPGSKPARPGGAFFRLAQGSAPIASRVTFAIRADTAVADWLGAHGKVPVGRSQAD